jgi:uncharacterized protein
LYLTRSLTSLAKSAVRTGKMPERAVTFSCQRDTVIGILHEPESRSLGIGVVFVVGGPQYRVGSHRQFVLMARGLAGAGYPVLRFDHRGMGDSSGEARAFDAQDDDIRSAIDALLLELPSTRGVVLFGLCDAASAAMIYCHSDPRVLGLMLANPWVRTRAGEATAYVRHYYPQRLLQRSFWKKLLQGDVVASERVSEFFSALRRSFGGREGVASAGAFHFTDRMFAGLEATRAPILLLMSERDLTAREFDDLSRAAPRWARQLSSSKVRRFDVPNADHTFSSPGSLEAASGAALAWMGQIASKGRK